jgi:hypothetical protein
MGTNKKFMDLLLGSRNDQQVTQMHCMGLHFGAMLESAGTPIRVQKHITNP